MRSTTCPACGYTLEGLGDERSVRCPECGRRFSWRTIEIWQTEGKYIPPPRHGWLLFVTPVLMLALYIAGPFVGAGEILAIAAGWLWASGCLFVAFNQAMSRHGSVFALALAIPCAIVLGGVVTAVSGGVSRSPRRSAKFRFPESACPDQSPSSPANGPTCR
jgi:predicted RNA-binding Zn-ribbon protein involved in translation (DUF1610 family)